jgi:hypothetical protein
MVFVNISFADPMNQLTSTDENGDVKIGNVSSDNITLPQSININGKEIGGSLTNALTQIAGNINTIKAQVINIEQSALAANTKAENLDLKVTNLEEIQATVSSELASNKASIKDTITLTSFLSEKIASQEAMIKNLQNFSSESANQGFNTASLTQLGLDHMDLNSATISSTLFVLGRTTLADVGVTGTISSGVLTIKGLNDDGTSSINTFNSDLRLQNEGMGGIDILAGKIRIDKNGNMTVINSITANEINTQKLNITANTATTSATLSASAGVSTIMKNTSSVTIKTTAVTKDSLIYVTFNGDYSPAVRYWTEGKTAGKSFIIKLDAAVANDVKLNWWIVN